MIAISIANRQRTIVQFDAKRLTEAIQRVLAEAGYAHGEVSLAIVDDTEMQSLNARWLEHDWPTDVLSFMIDDGEALEAEIIVSAETAVRQAQAFSWQAEDELLLYVVHGALHLVGYDDGAAEDRAAMRAAERGQLAHFGLEPRYTE